MDLQGTVPREGHLRAEGAQNRHRQRHVGSALKGGNDLYGRVPADVHEGEDQPRDELTADVSPHAVVTPCQRTAEGDLVILAAEGKALVAAQLLVDAEGALEKTAAPPQSHLAAEAEGKGNEEAQGASALTALQHGGLGLHEAVWIHADGISLRRDGSPQRPQAIHAGQDVLAEVHAAEGAGLTRQSRADEVSVRHALGGGRIHLSAQGTGLERYDHDSASARKSMASRYPSVP